jgi:hypothetical protein
MPTAEEILLKNLLATRLPSQSADVTVTTWCTGNPAAVVRRTGQRVVSRLDRKADGRITYAVMSRVTSGQPVNGRLLIEQRLWGSPWPLTFVRDPVSPRPRQYPFQPWQPFDPTASRWMDYIIPPPCTFTADVPAAPPAASDPTWNPPVPCWVVNLTLAGPFWSPEPRSMRLWIAEDPQPNLDHRVEQHLSNGTVRVILRTGPSLTTRITIDPTLGVTTEVTVDRFDPTPLPEGIFIPEIMAEHDW